MREPAGSAHSSSDWHRTYRHQLMWNAPAETGNLGSTLEAKPGHIFYRLLSGHLLALSCWRYVRERRYMHSPGYQQGKHLRFSPLTLPFRCQIIPKSVSIAMFGVSPQRKD
jgi:hypothetical protein